MHCLRPSQPADNSEPTVTPLTSTGRPPWTGQYTQCFLSQYNNALYVLGADSSDLSTVYIYDFTGAAWSTQATSGVPSDLGNSRSASVLDHDTNVIFTLTTGGQLYSLDLGNVKATASGTAAWSDNEAPSFSTSGYTPTLAEASNHINFFGVSGTAAGSADIFVIHYSYFQPTAQTYPTLNSGAAFPDTAGQAISVPLADSAQDQMIFVPSDNSNTYVITHWTNPGDYSSTSGVPFATDLINTTQILAAPSYNDPQSAYAASTAVDLVQIASNGDIYYMTGAINNYTVSSSASWTKMSYSLTGVTGGSNSSASTGSQSASGSQSQSATSRTGTASASRTSGAAGSGASSGASASVSPSSAAMAQAKLVGLEVLGISVGLMAVGAALVL